MLVRKFIKGHINFIILAMVQGLAIVGLICAFTPLFVSIWNGENRILWMLFFAMPLVVFVLWVWVKAIIPWTFMIIDSEHEKYLENEKEN